MTLQKMVEAMIGEIERQGAEGRWNTPLVIRDGHNLELVEDEPIDLELLARAGLEAITEPPQHVWDAGREAAVDETGEYRWDLVWPAMIAAVRGDEGKS